MNVQIVLHTTGGEVYGKWDEVTEEQMTNLRSAIKEMIGGEKLNYLDLDTDRGWVVVPGDQLLYLEARTA